MIELSELTVTNHFLKRCSERAPFLVSLQSKKLGGGYKPNLRALDLAISFSERIDRPKSIQGLLKHGVNTVYLVQKRGYGKPKNRMVFVVTDNKLITIYKYNTSWANK